jgi:hypothetical protein
VVARVRRRRRRLEDARRDTVTESVTGVAVLVAVPCNTFFPEDEAMKDKR